MTSSTHNARYVGWPDCPDHSIRMKLASVEVSEGIHGVAAVRQYACKRRGCNASAVMQLTVFRATRKAK